MMPRSYLFVPGDRPARFGKALASGADVVVLDLEDAVAEAAKSVARQAIAEAVRAMPATEAARIAVRINAAGSPEHEQDLRMVRALPLAAVMLPKAENAAALAALHQELPGIALLPLCESALGVSQALPLAGAPGVQRLVFGTLDYALDLGLDLEDDLAPLEQAAAQLVLASRLAGRAAPVAGVTPQLGDAPRLQADTSWALRRGFGAKLCIHPDQVAPLHAAMAPGAQALAWAARVIEADAASPGAARVDGRMVDRPVVLQAQRTLARAGR